MKNPKKTFLIIGMGSFGHQLCRALAESDCEIMIVDRNGEMLEDMLPCAVSAKVGDCTRPEVLRTFDIPAFDACFVCIGEDFQNSLEITSLLKELGARQVYSKAETEVQAKFLLRVGADQVIYPERDMARRIAYSVSSDNIFDYIALGGDYSLFELEVQPQWVGRSISALDFRSHYRVTILAIKKGEELLPLPTADYVFCAGDHIMALGHQGDIRSLR